MVFLLLVLLHIYMYSLINLVAISKALQGMQYLYYDDLWSAIGDADQAWVWSSGSGLIYFEFLLRKRSGRTLYNVTIQTIIERGRISGGTKPVQLVA